MHRKAETHKPGNVSRIIDGVELKQELAEIILTDPAYGKLRIVNFLADEMGKKLLPAYKAYMAAIGEPIRAEYQVVDRSTPGFWPPKLVLQPSAGKAA